MDQPRFADLPFTPAAHFRLYFYGAVVRVVTLAADALGGIEPAIDRFPFLRGYVNELAQHGLEGVSFEDAPRWWQEALRCWEQAAPAPLPLAALRAALDLDHDAVLLLVAAGLAEEDARYAELLPVLHGGAAARATTTVLGALSGLGDRADARPLIRRLVNDGLLQVRNPDDPFPDWLLAVPSALWDAVRGDIPETPAPGLWYRPATQALPLAQLILPDTVRATIERLPALITAGEIGGLVLRGPQHNGRRTLLAAIAAAAGYGVLEVRGLERPDDERWRLVGPLATLLKAVPLVETDLAPGETLRVPALGGYRGPRGFVLGNQGGIDIVDGEQLITVRLTAPPATMRRQHWLSAVAVDAGEIDRIVQQFRMSSGSIRRAAALAHSQAALAGRASITKDDVREAARALGRETLDALAAHEPVRGDWSQVVCSGETRQELATLEARCRQREQLAARVGPALAGSLNAGVRALLKGPSGTGKTLAARILAAELGMDLYRVDLAAIVNKYIGETEKNLHRIFARAEELDVMLLFDEGDALLGRRTSVSSANDRYANLETNFLLQRLESHEGVVLITTNAADHIDSAFQRRMDVVVDFRAPEAAERLAIWRLHLPPDHHLAEPLLREVAQRCVLTGGQIRNVVLHAALLATLDDGPIGAAHLEAAILREYRKLGSVCPLRRGAPRPALSGA